MGNLTSEDSSARQQQHPMKKQTNVVTTAPVDHCLLNQEKHMYCPICRAPASRQKKKEEKKVKQ